MPFIWIVNGLLACLYLLADHAMAALMVIPLIGMYWMLPRMVGNVYSNAMRPAMLVAASLSLMAANLAPAPAPLLLLVMVLVSAIAVRLEKFRPDETYWTFIQGVILYSLIGIGSTGFLAWMQRTPTGSDSILGMGRNYVAIMAAVALWGTPLGYLAMLLKGLLVHPPLPGGNPGQLIDSIRTRNQAR